MVRSNQDLVSCGSSWDLRLGSNALPAAHFHTLGKRCEVSHQLVKLRYATDEDVPLLAELNRQLIQDEGAALVRNSPPWKAPGGPFSCSGPW